MAEGLRQVAELPDPIGETVMETVRPNGLVLEAGAGSDRRNRDYLQRQGPM